MRAVPRRCGRRRCCLLVAGCGSGDDDDAASPTAPATVEPGRASPPATTPSHHRRRRRRPSTHDRDHDHRWRRPPTLPAACRCPSPHHRRTAAPSRASRSADRDPGDRADAHDVRGHPAHHARQRPGALAGHGDARRDRQRRASPATGSARNRDFHHLDQLVPGDEVIMSTLSGRHVVPGHGDRDRPARRAVDRRPDLRAARPRCSPATRPGSVPRAHRRPPRAAAT